jgi:HAD superfamily hydrolase (TIGR01509 family)
MRDELGVPLAPEEISRVVVDRMRDVYRSDLRLMPGARGAVERIGARWPLGLASSSNREIIDLVLDVSGLAPLFRVTVSSEEVARGKPAPDVYLEAARRLKVAPETCAAVEDSNNGIRSAKAAGMRVIAMPNPHFPPDAESLALADVTLGSLAELTPTTVAGDGTGAGDAGTPSAA